MYYIIFPTTPLSLVLEFNDFLVDMVECLTQIISRTAIITEDGHTVHEVGNVAHRQRKMRPQRFTCPHHAHVVEGDIELVAVAAREEFYGVDVFLQASYLFHVTTRIAYAYLSLTASHGTEQLL